MKNLKKKGFTIVELVIVIAVIAVLAAVLIPTFVNLTKKANISADQQAVNHMNKLLAMDTNKATSADEVIEILIENGYQSDLTTYHKDYSLAWIEAENKIVLVENNEVVWPKDYEGKTFVTLKPMVKDVEELLSSLEDGKTVFVSEDIVAGNAADLHFNTTGSYGLNLNGNTILTNVPNDVKGYKDGVVINENANVVISNGTIEGGTDVEQVVAVYDEAKLEIKDSVITGGEKIAVLAEAGGSVVISDSKIFGIGTNPVQNYGGSLTLNNVTIAQSGESDGAYYYNSAILIANLFEIRNGVNYLTGKKSETIINGGNYSGKNTIYVVLTGGDVTINGGTFIGTDYVINAGFGEPYVSNSPDYSSVITINGGTFNGNIKVSTATKLVINGGTFSVDPTQYVAVGHSVTKNVDGTWTVK